MPPDDHAPSPTGSRLPVAVLGATGSVGQRFVSLLEHHPWFELVAVGASARSAGRAYGEAAPWVLPTPIPEAAAGLTVRPPEPGALEGAIVFSALGAEVAEPIERAFAADGRLVVSNASSHRMHPKVPLLVPEVNPDALDLLETQDFGPGGIVANPNCSTMGLVLTLKPLHDLFGLAAVQVVTLQALSGAGLAGPSAFELTDSLIPFIPGEEEKLQTETLKILGLDALPVGAACNRVPVVDGHTLCVSVALGRDRPSPATDRAGAPPDLDRVLDAWRGFRGEPQERRLPSAPRHPLHVLDAPDAPQPRRHRDLEGGMAASVGRLRPCPVLDLAYVTLSHNTVRGAAGGALLAAELAVARGHLPT